MLGSSGRAVLLLALTSLAGCGLPDEAQARWYVESLATLLTASVLIRHAPAPVAEAYVATRLAGERGRTTGAIGAVDSDAILSRL